MWHAQVDKGRMKEDALKVVAAHNLKIFNGDLALQEPICRASQTVPKQECLKL